MKLYMVEKPQSVLEDLCGVEMEDSFYPTRDEADVAAKEMAKYTRADETVNLWAVEILPGSSRAACCSLLNRLHYETSRELLAVHEGKLDRRYCSCVEYYVDHYSACCVKCGKHNDISDCDD